MSNGREPRQVARRAIILSAFSFRSSLEVTVHPSVDETSQRLLPWLSHVGCEGDIDPLEREQLATPLCQLSASQRVDLKWAGESAAFLCWTLGLGAALEAGKLADPTNLPTFRSVLKPGALDLIESASLRSRDEIEAACLQQALAVSLLRESRVPPHAAAIVRRICMEELNRIGHPATESDVDQARQQVAALTPEDRANMAGAYAVRRHAAIWFLSGRDRYFA